MFRKIFGVAFCSMIMMANIEECSATVPSVKQLHFESPQKLLSGIVDMSSIKLDDLCHDFVERYKKEKPTLDSGPVSENEILRSEFGKATKVLDDINQKLSETAGIIDWASTLKSLKELTENGFYQTVIIYSRDIQDSMQKIAAQNLIQDFWQLLLQAQEIVAFKLSKEYTREETYKLDELLMDVSSAINWATKHDMVADKGSAAKASQISFGLSANFGNEGTMSEILSCAEEEQDPDEYGRLFFEEFFDRNDSELKGLGLILEG